MPWLVEGRAGCCAEGFWLLCGGLAGSCVEGLWLMWFVVTRRFPLTEHVLLGQWNGLWAGLLLPCGGLLAAAWSALVCWGPGFCCSAWETWVAWVLKWEGCVEGFASGW